jgi:hypothetical protein
MASFNNCLAVSIFLHLILVSNGIAKLSDTKNYAQRINYHLPNVLWI